MGSAFCIISSILFLFLFFTFLLVILAFFLLLSLVSD